MRKILLPMAIAMIVQAGLFSGNVLWGGTLDKLNHNAFDILNAQVVNRRNYLENEMLQRWAGIREVGARVASHIYEQTIDKPEDRLPTNAPEASALLVEVAPELIDLIRKNSVTGAFLVLEGGEQLVDESGKLVKTALYIRDMDPTTNLDDNSDLLILRAPPSVSKQLGIPLDTRWKAHCAFDTSITEDWEFYSKPYTAAEEHPEIGVNDLGYWSQSFRLEPADMDIITYSMPLRGKNGVVYGVLGVELSSDFLRAQLPYNELNNDKKGMYMLGVDATGDGTFEVVQSTGPVFKNLFGENRQLSFAPRSEYQNSFRVSSENYRGSSAYGCIQYFTLYNTNTPFEHEQWALIGLIEEDQLLSFSKMVSNSVWITWALSLVIGLFAAWFASLLLARPISALARQVQQSDSHEALRLNKIDISEIDELSQAIETLSDHVVGAAGRLSRIIEVAGVPIGAFEYLKESDKVFCTERFFSMMGMSVELSGDGMLDTAAFNELIEHLCSFAEQSLEDGKLQVLRLRNAQGEPYWIRLKIVTGEGHTIGVATDITQEVLERRKIEHERDYDLLTNLLNRRAFVTGLSNCFAHPERLGVAALIMLDLDNLKYINDNYGHDYGDEYIRCMANALRRYAPPDALVARMSGDEFYVFLYGFDSRELTQGWIHKLHDGVLTSQFPLPDDEKFRVRASAGIAWYPDDSESYETLIKYADFAMYKVKSTTKGEFTEFDRASYDRDSYLLQKKEDLNRLIEHELVTYHFQPIVSARDGEIFGYEALMRPTIESIRTPLEVLSLAKSQSKLHIIERLTWYKSLEVFVKLQGIDPQTRLFVNSIADQILALIDRQTLEQRYPELLMRVVVEFTEEEKSSEENTSNKVALANEWNVQIALDDFGTGYNSDVALLSINPSFVKIDVSIVRDIDTDMNRQNLLQNLISYSQTRGILVIAEGVETHGEMEMLVAMGVDLLQGYYVARPQAEPTPIPQEIKDNIMKANNLSAIWSMGENN